MLSITTLNHLLSVYYEPKPGLSLKNIDLEGAGGEGGGRGDRDGEDM